MWRFAAALALLLLGCPGSNNTNPRGQTWSPGDASTAELDTGGPGEIASIACPAMPFKDPREGPTQLGLCERLGWHVSRCEMQGTPTMTAEERCALVARQDKRRAAIQSACLERPLDHDVMVERYNTLMNCVAPPMANGQFRVTFCHETLSCLKAAQITW